MRYVSRLTRTADPFGPIGRARLSFALASLHKTRFDGSRKLVAFLSMALVSQASFRH
jgi:hypothetical protein